MKGLLCRSNVRGPLHKLTRVRQNSNTRSLNPLFQSTMSASFDPCFSNSSVEVKHVDSRFGTGGPQSQSPEGLFLSRLLQRTDYLNLS